MTIQRPERELSQAAPRPASAARLQWPDVAKGACILLVVLHHVTSKQYLVIVPEHLGWLEATWEAVTTGLKPIRMPLFFVISGWFAASAVARPWAASRRRVVGGFFLYAVWLLVYWGVYTLETTTPANRTEGVADLVGELLWAATSMWFLYALVVYFVLAKALRPLPPGLVVGVATVVSATVSFLPLHENNRVSVLAHFAFFALGAYFPHLLRRFAEQRPPVAPLLAAYGAGCVVLLASDVPRSVAATLCSAVGIPLGVALAVRVSGTPVGAGLAWLGSRTMRVYVLHLVVLVLLLQVPHTLGDGGPATLLAALAYPLVVTALVVAGCFALHAVLVRAGLGFLFDAPDWVAGRRVPAAR